jgi:uncharacterized protein YciI
MSIRPGGMADCFLVKRVHGPSWNTSRPRREQVGWDEHAAFMDRLVAERFIVLGGPVGEDDGDYALLVVEADSEADVRARLADDPWGEDMLATESIERWTIFLRRSSG